MGAASSAVRNPTRLTRLGSVITELGHPARFAAGEFLFVEGDEPSDVFAVLSGRIHIVRALRCGRQVLLGIKHPIEEFGELSAVDDAPRSAAAFAPEASVVARLASHRFRELLEERPDLGLAITRSLAAQLRETNERLCAHNSESTVVRTGHQLVELATLVVKHNGMRGRTELAITQRELADWIGASREATARALAEFRREGLVETKRGRIIVNDISGLTEMVNAAED